MARERRKLVLQMQVSVDGFIGRRGEGDAWQFWDWSDACPWDADLRGRFNEFFETIDCILLSRPMAAGYVAHWADIALRLGDTPDFAFGSRIATVPVSASRASAVPDCCHQAIRFYRWRKTWEPSESWAASIRPRNGGGLSTRPRPTRPRPEHRAPCSLRSRNGS
ncbi:MAG TPA: hypothetical protein VGD08_06875 [Stellaceae bacterium]|jgi:hypothetical protein